jgi:thioredoxin reductase
MIKEDDTMTDTLEQQQGTDHGRTVEIKVNNKPVQIHGPRVTGLQIKETAKAQGVAIELDFVLSEVQHSGETKVVGDKDIVTVTKHSKFTAVADDDNS